MKPIWIKKIFLCVMGILLLIILIKIKDKMLHEKQTDRRNTEEELHNTEQQISMKMNRLENVYVISKEEKNLVYYYEGKTRKNQLTEDLQNVELEREIADLVLKDSVIIQVLEAEEMFQEKLMSITDNSLEFMQRGRIPLAIDCQGYYMDENDIIPERNIQVQNIPIGTSLVHYFIKDGEICGFVINQREDNDKIRVLIKTSDYKTLLHKEIIVSCDCDYYIEYRENGEICRNKISSGESICITAKDIENKGRVRIMPESATGKICLLNVERTQKKPFYSGTLELIENNNEIAVINEVDIEDYLKVVVPSEMPSGYPMEALKAQAICARTYAILHMQRAGYPQYGAHLDDSTSYQVYNNIESQEKTTKAVLETAGSYLVYGGKPANTYYYSTSCGVGSDEWVWKNENSIDIPYLDATYISKENRGLNSDELRDEENFREFIMTKEESDFECDESWYRWKYEVESIDEDILESRIRERYEKNPKQVLTKHGSDYIQKDIRELGKIKEIKVQKRGAGGIAEELIIQGDKNEFLIISEYNIRYILNNGNDKLQRQDGSEITLPTLLPSAFFVIDVEKNKGNVVGYRIVGGGFGHGVGMSQNAAKNMAEKGYSGEEILDFFFRGCRVKNDKED